MDTRLLPAVMTRSSAPVGAAEERAGIWRDIPRSGQITAIAVENAGRSNLADRGADGAAASGALTRNENMDEVSGHKRSSPVSRSTLVPPSGMRTCRVHKSNAHAAQPDGALPTAPCISFRE